MVNGPLSYECSTKLGERRYHAEHMRPRISAISSPDSEAEHCSLSDCDFDEGQPTLRNPDDQPVISTNHGQELPSPEQQDELDIVLGKNRSNDKCLVGVAAPDYTEDVLSQDKNFQIQLCRSARTRRKQARSNL